MDLEERLDERLECTRGKRSYVRDQRISTEKAHREQRIENSKKRRNESILRRSEPLTKQMKMEKKSRVMMMKLAVESKTYTNRDVEREHQSMVDRMAMLREDKHQDAGVLAALEVYFKNYNDWKLAKSNQLTDALEADSRNLRDTEYEEKVKRDREIRAVHKKNMSATLEQISEDFVYRTKPRRKFSTVTSYFNKPSSENVKRLERDFNEFYFSQVVGNTSRCHRFPEFEKENDESDEERDSLRAENVCSICSGELIVDSKQGELVCTSCGVSKTGGFGVGLKQTFSESQSSSRSGAPYVRSSHVSFVLKARAYPFMYPLLNSRHLILSSSVSSSDIILISP